MAIRVESRGHATNNDSCTGKWSNNSGKFTQTWRFYNAPLNTLESSKFSPEANLNIKWSLKLCSKSMDDGKESDIYLHCTTINGWEVEANFEISAIDGYGAEQKGTIVTTHHIFTPIEPICKLLQISFPKSFYDGNDSVTIICKILFNNDTDPTLVESLKSRISQDYRQLFMSQDFSDITLTVSGNDIPAHKTVLAARSPVFFAMFKHDMKELKTNCATIDDFDHEVVLEMLRFIYTDEAPNLNEMAINLLPAADKYGLERLKIMCAEALRKNLDVENALNIWVLSDLHSVEVLKKAAVNFICLNIKKMIDTTGFKSLAEAYPDFMIEIVRILSTNLID